MTGAVSDETVSDFDDAFAAAYFASTREGVTGWLRQDAAIRAGLGAVLPRYGPSWAEVEAWLMAHRDRWHMVETGYSQGIDTVLDDLRNRMAAGVPLGREVTDAAD